MRQFQFEIFRKHHVTGATFEDVKSKILFLSKKLRFSPKLKQNTTLSQNKIRLIIEW